MNVSPKSYSIATSPGLSLVRDIHPLLLIGQRLRVAICPARHELLFEELSARVMV